jgi:hypothetical protein
MAAFEDLSLYGVPLVILVLMLMEVFKRIWPGLKDRRALIVTLGTGVALSVLAKIAALAPWFEEWFAVIFAGLMVSLLASGVYSHVKVRPPPAEDTTPS